MTALAGEEDKSHEKSSPKDPSLTPKAFTTILSEATGKSTRQSQIDKVIAEAIPPEDLEVLERASITKEKLYQIAKIEPAEERSAIQQTLALIYAGGPFPYRQDGTVFSNREHLLPAEAHGYYHEYTVPTPGSPDRGARRIVMGSQGEAYYTDDHYRSFWRIR